MCNPTEFQPHREDLPRRHCAECRAVLSTGNNTDTCWVHDKSWGSVTEWLMSTHHADQIGDAIDRIMVAA